MRVLLALALALALALSGALGLLPLEADQLRAAVGGHAVMNCHLDFPFNHEIPYHLQWDKDGETIFSWYSGEPAPAVADRWGGRLRLARAPALGRGSLNVSAVRETDSGLYRCRVTFPNRTPPARNDGVYYRLLVDGGDLIVTPPMNVTVLEGARAELECRPRSAAARPAWLKDGVPLEALPALAARAAAAANGSLVLAAAAAEDAGRYTCRVPDPDHPAAVPHSAAAYLDVQYAAKVVYAPPERSLPLGKPASLDCHFSANPPLTNLRWEKDGFLFDPYNVPGVFYSRNGSLLFNQVDESHEGEYSCTPYNALGTAGAAPRVRVRVLRAPELLARPQPLYLVRRGSRLTLPCLVAPRGRDSPLLLWTRREGAPLPVGRHSLEGGNLTISDVRPEDAGRYTCSVSNEAAALSAHTELRVDGAPPRAPAALEARAAARSLRLRWRAAAAAGAADHDLDYDVWYRERAQPEWRTMRILSRGVTEAAISGLRPDTEYELRVLAQDHIGDGLFSRPLLVRTEPDGSTGEGDEATSFVTMSPDADTDDVAGDSVAAPMAEGEGEGERPPSGELQVTLRLVEEGALVRWRRERGAAGRCSVLVTEDGRLAHKVVTHHEYALVGAVTEGAALEARVECERGAGTARLTVPAWGRLRGAAAAAVAALLLLAAAAALYVLRRRLLALARR